MKNKSYDEVCTSNGNSNCKDCELNDELNCQFNFEDFKFLTFNKIPALVLAFFGMTMVGFITGVWWPIVVYIILCIAIWILGIENRFLCSHCPYYAEDSKTLRCHFLHGIPKLWEYQPGPMNNIEKTVLVGVFLSLLSFPIAVDIYGIFYVYQYFLEYGLIELLGVLGITIATSLAFFQLMYIITHNFCSKCVNFSCPLNNVSKPLVDEYLENNPIMKEAWLESGYEFND